MTDKDIIRQMLAMRDWSQTTLAEKMGLESQGSVSWLLNGNKNGIRMDYFHKAMSALGCKIIIQDEYGSKKEWVIDMKPELEKSPIPGEEPRPKRGRKPKKEDEE